MERKYFTRSMPLPTLKHSFRTCGSPKAFTSTTILGNVVEKLAQKCRNSTSRKPIRSSSTQVVKQKSKKSKIENMEVANKHKNVILLLFNTRLETQLGKFTVIVEVVMVVVVVMVAAVVIPATPQLPVLQLQ